MNPAIAFYLKMRGLVLILLALAGALYGSYDHGVTDHPDCGQQGGK